MQPTVSRNRERATDCISLAPVSRQAKATTLGRAFRWRPSFRTIGPQPRAQAGPGLWASISSVDVGHTVIRFVQPYLQHHCPVTAEREVRNAGGPAGRYEWTTSPGVSGGSIRTTSIRGSIGVVICLPWARWAWTSRNASTNRRRSCSNSTMPLNRPAARRSA
jgi:hypothetical protein